MPLTMRRRGREEFLPRYFEGMREGWAVSSLPLYCFTQLKSAKFLSEDSYEVTLTNGMEFKISVPNQNFGDTADPTFDPRFHPPRPPGDLLPLADSHTLVGVFRHDPGYEFQTPNQRIKFALLVAGRIYIGKITSDIYRDYLRPEDVALAQERFRFGHKAPVAQKTQEKLAQWWQVKLADGRAFRVPASEVGGLHSSDDVVVLDSGEHCILVQNSQVIRGVVPMGPPVIAYWPTYPGCRIPYLYGLESWLARESHILCTSPLSEGVTLTGTTDDKSTNPILLSVKLENGMSFDCVCNRWQEKHKAYSQDWAEPRTIAAEKGSLITVLEKESEIGPTESGCKNSRFYSIFLDGWLYEAIPKHIVALKGQTALGQLAMWRGIGCTDIHSVEAIDSANAKVVLNAGAACQVHDPEHKINANQFAIVFYDPQEYGKKIKLMTESGVVDGILDRRDQSHFHSIEEPLVPSKAAPLPPLSWSKRGWDQDCPWPAGFPQISIAMSPETRAVLAEAKESSEALAQWKVDLMFGLRDIWWNLLSHAKHTPITLGDTKVMGHAYRTHGGKVVITGARWTDLNPPAPPIADENGNLTVVPKTYINGEAQVLITLTNHGCLDATVLTSTLPPDSDRALLNSIKANAHHQVFLIPGLPERSQASLLIRFRFNPDTRHKFESR